MKVLLINSKTFHAKHLPAMPLGLLSIATYLTANGHTVQIYDREVERGNLNKIETFTPDIVGISGPSYENFNDAVKLSKFYKARNIPVVWGGQMASLIPEIVLKSGIVDYVVVGEGEITFLALLNTIINKTPFRDIDGLTFLEGGEPVINKEREFADLAQLPIIDFSFINPKKYFGPYIGCERMLYIYASKGCLFQCTYCYNSCLSKGVWRPRPPEYFLSEIKYLVDNYNVDGVLFVDDLFGPSIEYMQKICTEIAQSAIGFVWGCYTRADLCTKEVLEQMYGAGCRWIMFGIESGSEERQKTTKKRLNLDKSKEIISFCKEIGIFTTATFMLGFPNETEDELRQTIQYMQDLDSNAKVPNFCGILPKSEMYESMVKSKILQAPQSWKEYINFKMMDNLGKNYSKIPDKELKVVSACFYWEGIFTKDPHDEKRSRVFARRAFMQTMESFKRGTLYSFMLVITAAKELLGIFYYAKMFPKIQKKYGLGKTQRNSSR